MWLPVLALVFSFVSWVVFFSILAERSEDSQHWWNSIWGIWSTWGIALMLTIIWIVGLAPFFQPLLFHVFYNNLGLWIILIAGVAILLIAAGALAIRFAKIGEAMNAVGTVSVVLFVIGWFITWAVMGGSWTKNHIYRSVEYASLTELPETTALRYLPLEVAKTFGTSKFQEPRMRLGDAEPLIVGEEVLWLLPRVPNGSWNSALRNADGFTVVDNTGEVTQVSQQMKYGEGMWGTDAISWKLRQQRYWSTFREILYVQTNDGQVVAVVPYLDYSMKFPVLVPRWGGVFLVFSNGKIENLSPQQAIGHPFLQGVRIFPEELARIYVEAYAYKQGIWNVLFAHEDQIQIPWVAAGIGNEMPFLLPTSSGQKWFVAAVPWGARGIYRIFMVDAVTGHVELFALDQRGALIGPSRAYNFIKNAYPCFDWDSFAILEPRPIVRSGELYWMFTITPTTYAGITQTVLVNSRTSEILSLGVDKTDALAFLRGENTGRPVSIGEQGANIPLAVPTAPSMPSNVSPETLEETIRQLEQALNTLKALESSQR